MSEYFCVKYNFYFYNNSILIITQTFYNILPHTFQMFLTIHSYGQYILHPWGYAETEISDSNELWKMGQIGAKAIQKVNPKRKYKVGNAAKLLYVASGN